MKLFITLLLALSLSSYADKHKLKKALSEALLEGDKVELFILNFEMTNYPNFQEKDILQTKKLDEKQSTEFIASFTKHLKNKGGGLADCHFPIHGIKVYMRDKVIFKSSFCWTCGNFYIENKEVEIPSGSEMKELFEKYLPIPQKEIDRFKRKYKSKL